MRVFLGLYCHRDKQKRLGQGWKAMSRKAACVFQKGENRAKRLREWTRAFIADYRDLPEAMDPVGRSTLLENVDLKNGLARHLQGIGKYVRAMDIVDFTASLDIQEKYSLSQAISLSCAQGWMKTLDYCWTKGRTGQFTDGHECSDVVKYRQDNFLPKMVEWDDNTRKWNDYGTENVDNDEHSKNHCTVYWHHDESIFYANDWRKIHWVHKHDKPELQPKGEGASIMVADFVSADYGWLQSPDGTQSTRLYFYPGKNRDGYFTHQHFLNHVTQAMNILTKYYPKDHHVFIFDNATTHLARTATALSARRMTKNATQQGRKPFGVEVNVLNEKGEIVYGVEGRPQKRKERMSDGQLADGTPQSLYFPVGHQSQDAFKGMVVILEERGFQDINNLRAECTKFKCPPWNPLTPCCCRRLLYNQPDFRDIEPEVVGHCQDQGLDVVFLPKFHCELNCIEQCWGYAKRVHRELPESPREADIERNVQKALDAIPLETIRR